MQSRAEELKAAQKVVGLGCFGQVILEPRKLGSSRLLYILLERFRPAYVRTYVGTPKHSRHSL